MGPSITLHLDRVSPARSLPVAIQHSTGHYVRAAFQEDGKWMFKPRAMKDLQSFSRVWARNLLAQGFARGLIVYAAS
jgi:hypothetical protein